MGRSRASPCCAVFHVEHRRRWPCDVVAHVFHVEHRPVLDPAGSTASGCRGSRRPGRPAPDRKSHLDELPRRGGAGAGGPAVRRSRRSCRPPPRPRSRPAEPNPSRSRRRPEPAGPPAPPRHRRGQPEGRRRQDDDDDQRRRLPRRARSADADHRPRPAGQRLDRPRHREPWPGDLDVPRADARGAAGELHRADRRQGPVRGAGEPRSGRGRDRAGAGVQPGDPAQAGDRRRHRRLRLRPHRLPAVARAADRQRPQRGAGGAGADPVRVLRPRRSRPAAAQRRPRAAQPEPASSRSARSCA